MMSENNMLEREELECLRQTIHWNTNRTEISKTYFFKRTLDASDFKLKIIRTFNLNKLYEGAKKVIKPNMISGDGQSSHTNILRIT